jgi:aryl-alcohol dehydrogenase-like predicted oxidoreductase
VRKAGELGKLARELGATTAQLAIGWCLLNPNVSTVILGATNAAQLRENLGALRILPELRQGVVERIESIVANKPAAPQRY